MSYKLQILDQSGASIRVLPKVYLDKCIILLPNGGKLQDKLAQSFEIPNAPEDGPKAFFPAGVNKLTKINDEVFFVQDEISLFKVNVESGNLINLNLSNIGLQEQPPSLVKVAMNNFDPTDTLIRIHFQNDFGSLENIFMSYGKHWKFNLPSFVTSTSLIYWKKSGAEQVRIFFDQSHLESLYPGTIFDGPEDDYLYVYCLDKDSQVQNIPIETFMIWNVHAPPSATLVPFENLSDRLIEGFDKLKISFQHTLTQVGNDASDYVKANILDRYSAWVDKTELIAPIASLSQNSGTGKSKLSVEIIQDCPGFYIVTREKPGENQPATGYPKNNALSLELMQLASESDPIFQSFEKEDYSKCRNGLIIFFFSKIITVCLRDLHCRIKRALTAASSNEIAVTESDLVRLACAEVGKLFEKNDEIDCDMLLSSVLEKLIQTAPNDHTLKCKLEQSKALEEHILSSIKTKPEAKFTSVDEIAGYIKSILDDPVLALDKDEARSEIDTKAAELIQSRLNLFPFLFVLDEADSLERSITVTHEKHPTVKVTGFEVVRRAISYLRPTTRIFFLTIGTRSDVTDLNPPLRENSRRLDARTKVPKPIILLSNTSVFSRKEYPLEKIKISQAILKNPVFFKNMVTLGHPIWSTIKFDLLVKRAESKIVNGSSTSFEYVLVLWMVRAGLAASPKELSTRTLITSHMATLFDTSPDLARMIVFYPSDPILALACRSLTKSICAGSADILFFKLQQLFEGILVDRGQLAECVGVMNLLRAIDNVDETAVRECNASNVKQLVDEMKELYGESHAEFNDLWDKKNFVLEDDAEGADEKVLPTFNFSAYRVFTVKAFLESLLSKAEFDKIAGKLPSSTLDGLVNASHAVKIVRCNETLHFHGTSFPPINLPRADDRISDANCNLIDDHLLRLGLIHQCCFLMPDRYYAYDLIIPVMLPDDSYSFIGVQFKAANESFAEPIKMMQARLHYVKCPKSQPHSPCPDCDPIPCSSECLKTCPNCIASQASRDKLTNRIFANQITLLICLDPSEYRSFNAKEALAFSRPEAPLRGRRKRNRTSRFDNLLAQAKIHLLNVVRKPNADLNVLKKEIGEVKLRSSDFMKPLLSLREPFQNNSRLMLVSSVWYDELVALPGDLIEVSQQRKQRFARDKCLHRQYCIAIRGVDAFKHLYLPTDTIPNILRLIAEEDHFFKKFTEDSMDLFYNLAKLKSILYDASLNYVQFNDVLAKWRGLQGTDPILYPLLLQTAKEFYQSKIKTLSHSRPVDIFNWTINEATPSKDPKKFEALAQALFQSLPDNEKLLQWSKKS